jgi:antitoxin CptB
MKSEGQSIEDIDILRKRLIYRSWHRGTREMDLLLGSFADKHMPSFGKAELSLYEALLEQSDPDLYDWILGKEEPPANLMSDILQRLKSHKYK